MRNIVQASVIVTFRCNARCVMCETWKYPTKVSEELDPKYYERLPDGLRINVTGGEPMLRADIDDIFKVLYPKASLIELSTNGFFTDKIVSIAKRYPNTLIRVSVEGLPALNDKLRGIENGFDHALRTILELKKAKCKNIGFSVVISDKNAGDLVNLYHLCSYLGVELANSFMHNSWYFHKTDNVIDDRGAAARAEAEFIKSLLNSNRAGVKNKLKDYARAYFNKSILGKFTEGDHSRRPPCGAGKDFFFVDPLGNVSPCNGSEEQWIIGNLKESSFKDIMDSEKAREAYQKIGSCKRNCCFVVTERHDMVRRPWEPICWIVRNKFRLAFNIPVDFS
ncbi:MAG: radical SAM protein [Candidatus Omnitrophota bacterium]